MSKAVAVVFRWHQESVVALLPEIPGTNDWHTCTCVGDDGHGSADVVGVIHASRPATPIEYASLEKTLRRIGYVLDIKQRVSWHMHDRRHDELKRMRPTLAK